LYKINEERINVGLSVGLIVYLTVLFFLLKNCLQMILITHVSELSCGCVSSVLPSNSVKRFWLYLITNIVQLITQPQKQLFFPCIMSEYAATESPHNEHSQIVDRLQHSY